MAIVATPGGATSNSYGTIAEADAYFENHPDLETWDASTDKEEALIWAAIRLDEIDYIGEPASDTQAMQWPRVDDEDGIFELDWDDDEIPLKLKYAQFELAIARLKEAESGVSSSESQPISSLKVGNSVEVKYATSDTSTTGSDYTGLPDQASRFLRGLRLVAVLA